jgi:hypothetical protein
MNAAYTFREITSLTNLLKILLGAISHIHNSHNSATAINPTPAPTTVVPPVSSPDKISLAEANITKENTEHCTYDLDEGTNKGIHFKCP